MRKKWTDWRQISEVKSIQYDVLHMGDKGEGESRVTSVSGLNNRWLQGPLTYMGKTGLGTSLGKIIIKFLQSLFVYIEVCLKIKTQKIQYLLHFHV